MAKGTIIDNSHVLKNLEVLITEIGIPIVGRM